jgi:hypothetical protein
MQIDKNSIIHPTEKLCSSNIVMGENARVDADCVVGDGLVIGKGAWVRNGAVVTKSVPPHAVVEGNPAKIVGFLKKSVNGLLEPAPVFTASAIKIDLEKDYASLPVNGCKLQVLQEFNDSRGRLVVGEFPRNLPFSPQRTFFVSGVPENDSRGEHAHHKCRQFLICLNGSCRVLLDDGDQRCEIVLDRADIGLLMPEKIWGTQYGYSKNAIVLVLASQPYEVDDYIRSYEDFLTARLVENE